MHTQHWNVYGALEDAYAAVKDEGCWKGGRWYGASSFCAVFVSSILTMCLVEFLSGGWSSRNQQIWRHCLFIPEGDLGKLYPAELK